MFINYETSSVTISVTTSESVDVYAMRTTGAVEEVVDTESQGTWNLVIPAGAIWGFGVYNGLSYDPPDEEVTILLETGDNPWPQPPPPPPPLFQNVEDFRTRYEDFLMALASLRVRPERAA